ncbi:MAG: DUF1638 domain-containing protein [Acidimicrobiia bacterium]|nr:DUF1638 domain-containing protein [Acidimicrobiia bacterium]
MPDLPQVLILACGALAREYLDLIERNGWNNVTLECLPAKLHNTPKLITDAVRERLDRAEGSFDSILIGYADCGTGGQLDVLVDERGLKRLPGAHCYEFFATSAIFANLHDAEPGTLYLTDYLAKHFDRLIWEALGLDRWPELRDQYFGNYTRLMYLSQTDDPAIYSTAQQAAVRLGLDFAHLPTGYGDMADATVGFLETHGVSR